MTGYSRPFLLIPLALALSAFPCQAQGGTTRRPNVPCPGVPVVVTPPFAGATSRNRPASVTSNPGSTYAWTITNGGITAGQGTSEILFSVWGVIPPALLTLSVVETNAGNCASPPGTATVTVTPRGTAVLFHPITPCRFFDTRWPTGPQGAPSLAPGETRTFWMGVGCIPLGTDPTSLALNATVVSPTAQGELVLYSGVAALPPTSNLSFTPGRTRAGSSIVQLSSDGLGAIRATNSSAGALDLVLDVTGYFE